jgi:hypothetical protein
MERALAPVSSRRSDRNNPGEPTESEDLSPFALEAEDVVFARGWWSGRHVFVGADVERNLHDAETRFYVQVGALGEARW